MVVEPNVGLEITKAVGKVVVAIFKHVAKGRQGLS